MASPILDKPAEGAASSPDIVRLLLGSKVYLFLALVAGLGIGAVLYWRAGPAYQSIAEVMVSRRGTVLKDERDQTVGERGEHIALIMSPLIVTNAVRKSELQKLPSLKDESDPVDAILEQLKVRRLSGNDRSHTNLLEISYTSRHTKDASVIVGAVIKAYREYLAESQNEHTTQVVSELNRAIGNQRASLSTQQQDYIAFRKKAPFWWRRGPGGGAEGQGPGEATNVHQERVVFLDTQRQQLGAKRTGLESKLKALEDAIAKNDPSEALEILIQRFASEDGGGVSNGALTAEEISALRAMEQHILPLVQEERKLRREWGENHPMVLDIRRKIDATAKFYGGLGFPLPVGADGNATGSASEKGPSASNTRSADLVKRFVISLKREIAELAQRDVRIEAQFNEELRKAKELSNLQLEDQERMAAIRNDTKLLDTLVSQLSLLNIGKDTAGYALRVISNPREGVDMKKPLKYIGGAVGGCLALVLAGLYLSALTDTRLKSVEDVQQTLGVPIVGRIPHIAERTKTIAGSRIAPDVYYFHNPESPSAESFRSIRTALFVAAHSRGMKVLQVTSSEPQDGKTSLTTSLAVAMAQTGKKILLIDADLRCPKVQGLFGQSGLPGLTDVLLNEIELANAVQPSEVQHLSILGAGMSPASNPAELLTSPRFEALLREVRTDYDYVLVDTPPLLAVSDPCEIASLVDGVVMVVRLHKNRTASIKRAKDLLTTNGVEPLGVVVTGVEAGASYGAYSYRSTPLPARSVTQPLPVPAGSLPA